MTQNTQERDAIYQVSTLQALVLGNFYGSADMRTLQRHGDIGLGTFAAVAGELIVVDGRCYRVLGNGRAVEAKPEEQTPFASVAWLGEDAAEIHLGAVASIEALKKELDARVELLGLNYMYVGRIDGHFRRVDARTELPQQEPYKPFAKVLETDERRFTFADLEGTLVCFYFPSYLAGVNTPGWHLHFLSADRTQGGHVFDLAMTEGTVRLGRYDRFTMDLPHNRAFRDASLQQASQDEIAQIEQGK